MDIESVKGHDSPKRRREILSLHLQVRRRICNNSHRALQRNLRRKQLIFRPANHENPHRHRGQKRWTHPIP